MFSFSPLETYLLTVLLFPAVVAGGLTWFIVNTKHNALRRMMTDDSVESDVQNERLDPVTSRNAEFLLFALIFNLTYLTVNPLQVNQLLFHSAVFYAASIIAFLLGLFLALSFELRFIPHRFTILGIAFAAVGSVVATATLRFGFAQGEASADATGAANGALLAGQQGMILVPIVLVACAWVLALVALILEQGSDRVTLPFRIPWDKAYRLLIAGIVMGYIGILVSLIPNLMLLMGAH